MHFDQILANAKAGICTTPVPSVVVQQVVQRVQEQPVTCATPTNAFLINPDNILTAECATVEIQIDNTTDAAILVRFGGGFLGLPGGDALLRSPSTTPLAVDSPGALDPSYPAGKQANAPGLQYFNSMAALAGVWVTRICVSGASGSAQINTKMTQRTFEYDQDSFCKASKVAPICNECPDDINDTRCFDGNFFMDEGHSVEYIQQAGQNLTYELEIAAYDGAKGYVSCNGTATV